MYLLSGSIEMAFK